MSQRAERLRRIGKDRATLRADLNARDSAADAKRFGAITVRFAR